MTAVTETQSPAHFSPAVKYEFPKSKRSVLNRRERERASKEIFEKEHHDVYAKKEEDEVFFRFIHNANWHCSVDAGRLTRKDRKSWLGKSLIFIIFFLLNCKMKFVHLVKLVAVACVFGEAASQDYCNRQLCGGRQHVGCNNSGVSLF
jgi:hypothetical protein